MDVILSTVECGDIHYYSRIGFDGTGRGPEMAELAESFSERNFDYDSARENTTYLETGDTGDNTTFGRVDLKSNFNQLTYGGLIYLDGYYYYVRGTGEAVHGRSYWVTKTNGLLPEKAYSFDDEGRMIDPPGGTTPTPGPDDPTPTNPPEVKNGIVSENGSLWYYVDG